MTASGRHCGCVEQRAAVTHRRIRRKQGEHINLDRASSATTHRTNDIQEAAEVVIDDHLPGHAEQLALGGARDASRSASEMVP